MNKVASKRTTQKSNKLKRLDMWDWLTLVASWRYFEHGMTMASASFPEEIINRFFRGAYDEATCRRIANQFANIDHGNSGERDWTESGCLRDCDKTVWCTFYAFCKAYCDGFKTFVAERTCGSKTLCEEHTAFYCEYSKRWLDAESYRSNPTLRAYYADEFIKEVR